MHKQLKTYKQNIKCVLNKLSGCEINMKSKKWKKHFPFSAFSDEIVDGNIDYVNNSLRIKFKNNPGYLHYCNPNDYHWKSDEHSFSLSNQTPHEHVEFIKIQLQCYITNIDFLVNGTIQSRSNDMNCIVDITNKFNNEQGTHFDKVFAINVFPIVSIIYTHKTNTVKIATYYVLGCNGNKVNIFFGCDEIFDVMHNGCRGLQKYIEEYNDSNASFDIDDFFHICENLGPIFYGPHYFYALNTSIYEVRILKINKPRQCTLFTNVENQDDVHLTLCELNKLCIK